MKSMHKQMGTDYAVTLTSSQLEVYLTQVYYEDVGY